MKTQLSKPARSHARYTDEYKKEAYRQALAQHGLVPSMSRKANCYDNAFIESFFSSHKYELVYHHRFPTSPKLALPSSTISKSSITALDSTPVLPTKPQSHLNPN